MRRAVDCSPSAAPCWLPLCESVREARLAVGRDRAVAGQRAIATVAAERAAAAPERPVRGKQLRAQGDTIIKHEGLTGPGFSLGWSRPYRVSLK